MKSFKERVQFIQEGGLVQRFHTRPGIRPDTDASHQWMVAMLCYVLSPVIPSSELLMHALCHDLAEQRVGDVPAPTKWALGIGKELDDIEGEALTRYGLNFVIDVAEERILKLADAMAGMLYCCSEAALGNRTAYLMYDKWLDVVVSLMNCQRHGEVLNAVKAIWEESNGKEGPRFNVFAD